MFPLQGVTKTVTHSRVLFSSFAGIPTRKPVNIPKSLCEDFFAQAKKAKQLSENAIRRFGKLHTRGKSRNQRESAFRSYRNIPHGQKWKPDADRDLPD